MDLNHCEANSLQLLGWCKFQTHYMYFTYTYMQMNSLYIEEPHSSGISIIIMTCICHVAPIHDV